MRERAKALLGDRGRAYVRRLGRLRYVTKARKARAYGWSPRAQPRGWLREVVLSPEVDSYTYALENEGELAFTLAGVLGETPARVAAVLAEPHRDEELTSGLARDVGWRALWLKRRPELAGHHLSMWAAVRLLRPRLVVETGILEGLGSRTVLRALQRNAAEGHPGRLVSFDVMPTAGSLVPPRLAGAWTRVIESTTTGLDAHLGDAEVDVFLHDSLPDPSHQRLELRWALAHRARLAITTSGWTGVAQELAAAHGLKAVTFTDAPREHFFGGRQIVYICRD
jgi:hypothetical protein